jgi:hypothetical protein
MTSRTKETEMHTTTYGTGQFTRPSRTPFTTAGLVAAIVDKWRQHRMLRDAESLPYAVMKDIGFRAPEQKNAK